MLQDLLSRIRVKKGGQEVAHVKSRRKASNESSHTFPSSIAPICDLAFHLA